MRNRRAFALPARTSLLLACLAGAGQAQTVYGTVALDPSLAEASAQVTGVLNKNLQGGNLGFCEGPSYDAAGNAIFTEQNPNRIWMVSSSGQASMLAATDGLASNGTEIDPQGRLIVAQQNAVAIYSLDGTRTVLQNMGNNISVNDLTIASTGAMYFSHWGANVFFRSASGQVTQIPGFQIANGVEWIEERNKLYVSQDGPDQVWAYDVASDGRLSNGKVFATVKEPDGITADELGNIYVASWEEGKVFVFDTTGKSLGSVTVTGAPGGQGTMGGQNGNASNVVFGGPDRKTLYITGDGGLYKVPMKVAGRTRPGTTAIRRGSLFNPGAAGMRISKSRFSPSAGPLVFTLPGRNPFTVRIFDAKSREVWNASTDGSRIEWDGRSGSGQPIPPGRYFVSGEAAGKGIRPASIQIIR